MGSQVIAKCKCGLEATSLIGGGMRNFKTTQYFPAACSDCANVVEVNALDDTPQCPGCGSRDVTLYNDESLIDAISLKYAVEAWEDDGSEIYAEVFKDKIFYRTVAESFNLELIDCFYKCLSCGEFTLQFRSSGLMFD